MACLFAIAGRKIPHRLLARASAQRCNARLVQDADLNPDVMEDADLMVSEDDDEVLAEAAPPPLTDEDIKSLSQHRLHPVLLNLMQLTHELPKIDLPSLPLDSVLLVTVKGLPLSQWLPRLF